MNWPMIYKRVMLVEGDFVTRFLSNSSQLLEQDTLFMKMPFNIHLSFPVSAKPLEVCSLHCRHFSRDHATPCRDVSCSKVLFLWSKTSCFIHSLPEELVQDSCTTEISPSKEPQKYSSVFQFGHTQTQDFGKKVLNEEPTSFSKGLLLSWRNTDWQLAGKEHRTLFFLESLSENPNTQEIQKTTIPLTLTSHGNDPACCSVSACLIKCTETFANEAICMLLFLFITAALGVPINIRTLCLVQMSVCSPKENTSVNFLAPTEAVK